MLSYLEQASLYGTFTFDIDRNSSAENETARTQWVAAFLCPSDGKGFRSPGSRTYTPSTGYHGNIGATAAQIYSSPATGDNNPFPNQEANSSTVGVFNISLSTAVKATIKYSADPNLQKVNGMTTLAMFTDGTSNTAIKTMTAEQFIAAPKPSGPTSK